MRQNSATSAAGKFAFFEAADDGGLTPVQENNEEKHEFNKAEAGWVRLPSP
ncbi:MAG TPA: hypothetical protein PK597_03550 [Oscillospiraceae bacterium]|nr:hypothetical protein [Oscillospiraceae bacterium]